MCGLIRRAIFGNFEKKNKKIYSIRNRSFQLVILKFPKSKATLDTFRGLSMLFGSDEPRGVWTGVSSGVSDGETNSRLNLGSSEGSNLRSVVKVEDYAVSLYGIDHSSTHVSHGHSSTPTPTPPTPSRSHTDPTG